MSELVQPTNFPAVSIEDMIDLTLAAAGNPGEVEFRLESASGVTGWKTIELRSSSGRLINQVETRQADDGPHAFSVPVDDLVGARLIFAKAKMFGMHTRMYELENLSAFPGKSFQFLWQRDDDRRGPVAGFFRDLGNGISAAAQGVAGAVEPVVVVFAEMISSVFEITGNLLADALEPVGNFLARIPFIGAFFQFIFHWLGTILSALFDSAATLIKGVLDLVANVAAGIIRIVGGAVGGLFSWDGRLFVKGLGGFASGFAGAVIAILAKSIALVQACLFMQLGERPLTSGEKDLLRRIYRASVDLNKVRIITGFAGLFSVNPRPFTLGNRIYLKNVDPVADPSALVHECCHGWQNQHEGLRYIAAALWAQATLPGQGYSWQDELARGHFRWQDFNKEAQASFLQDIYRTGRRVPSTHTPGEFYDDDPVGWNVEFIGSGAANHTALARESVLHVRSA